MTEDEDYVAAARITRRLRGEAITLTHDEETETTVVRSVVPCRITITRNGQGILIYGYTGETDNVDQEPYVEAETFPKVPEGMAGMAELFAEVCRFDQQRQDDGQEPQTPRERLASDIIAMALRFKKEGQ